MSAREAATRSAREAATRSAREAAARSAREAASRATSAPAERSAVRPWLVIALIVVAGIVVTLIVALSGPSLPAGK
jgi:cell division septal protein FtsQ